MTLAQKSRENFHRPGPGHILGQFTSFFYMAQLPSDVVAMIGDMACHKQHNNSSSRYGLIVCVDVDFSKKIEGDFERALEEWIWDSLDRAHRALDFEIRWNFVCNVKHDQWEDDDSDDDERADPENRYQVCVHIKPPMSSGSGPLFSYSPRHAVETPVDPGAVLAQFTSPPKDVRAISVSGVDSATLRGEWEDCIASVPSRFCRAGEGYMVHPMFILPERFQADSLPRMFAQREKSFEFGWPNYNPE